MLSARSVVTEGDDFLLHSHSLSGKPAKRGVLLRAVQPRHLRLATRRADGLPSHWHSLGHSSSYGCVGDRVDEAGVEEEHSVRNV